MKGIHAIIPMQIQENNFIIVFITLDRNSPESLSFICITTDSVNVIFSIEYIVIYNPENLFAAEYIPFADTPKKQLMIVLLEELIIHQLIELGINGIL